MVKTYRQQARSRPGSRRPSPRSGTRKSHLPWLIRPPTSTWCTWPGARTGRACPWSRCKRSCSRGCPGTGSPRQSRGTPLRSWASTGPGGTGGTGSSPGTRGRRGAAGRRRGGWGSPAGSSAVRAGRWKIKFKKSNLHRRFTNVTPITSTIRLGLPIKQNHKKPLKPIKNFPCWDPSNFFASF